MPIKNFFFLPRSERKGITDSILLASGQEILAGTANGLSVNVVVCGEVRIDYKGKEYNNPDDFPAGLKRYLRRCKNIHLIDSSDKNAPTILNNNWYESRIYPGERVCDQQPLDVDILDLDLSTMTRKDARSLILDITQCYIRQHDK